MYSSEETADIFRIGARKLFGLLLGSLCEEAHISQNQLGKKAVKYRKYLVSKGHIHAERDTGAVEHSGLSRVIRAESIPSYSQVYIWLTLLRGIFNSDDYKQKCAKMNKQVYVFTKEHWVYMWHLACFVPPDEVIEAYHEYEHILKDRDTDELPVVRRTVKLSEESKQC